MSVVLKYGFIMHVTKILDCLYVGSCPTSQTDVQELKELGITAVLNLQTDEDIAWRNIDRDGVSAAYRAYRLREIRYPIRDFDYEDLRRRLPEAVRLLHNLVKEGHRVYVHCTAGMNRSPTVIIAYLHWAMNWDFPEAVQHVTRNHPCDPFLEAISEQSPPELDEDLTSS